MVNNISDRNLIEGWTAFALLRLRFRLTHVAVLLMTVLLILSLSGIPQSWFTSLMVFVAMGSGIAVTTLVGRVPARERAEKKAGYTTLQYGDKDLEQRDPYFGRVIRKPGDEYLQRKDFLAIVQAAKAAAEETFQASRSSRH